MENNNIFSRKKDHININLQYDVESGLTNGLEFFRFIHEGLPEQNLRSINLSLRVFQKELAIPLLISSMTGGTPDSAKINRCLAEAAQACELALGLGSLRVMIEKPELAYSFKVRKYAPDVLLFANLGAIQLNYAITVDMCRAIVESIEADALVLHLNPLQEALQSGGDTNFAGLADKIESVCNLLSIPVVVKEVGWGISSRTACLLRDCGVSAIDIAGAGGTSWSQVEMLRSGEAQKAMLAASFRDWGIPTADSIQMVKNAIPDMLIIASGGIQNGIEIAKCIALGARLTGIARPFLKAAMTGTDAIISMINILHEQLRIAMFSVGASCLEDLTIDKLIDVRK